MVSKTTLASEDTVRIPIGEDSLNQSDSAPDTEPTCSNTCRDATENLPQVVEQNLAAALFKLEHFAHVPSTKIDEFLEELHYLLSSAAVPLTVNSLKVLFQKHGTITDESSITEMAIALSESHPLIKVIGKSGILSTSYLRKLYYKECFKVLEPTEYILDAKHNKSFQYVPIIRTLQELLSKDDVVKKILENHRIQQSYKSSADQTLKSSLDGSHFKENSFFSGTEF